MPGRWQLIQQFPDTRMKKLGLLLGLLSILGLCLFLMLKDKVFDSSGVRDLEIYCAAGLQKPVEEIAHQYEDEHGVKVLLTFGGSGQLLAKLEVAGGDLYLPVDKSYVDLATERGLAAESFPVSRLTAGIIVAKGNPKNIKTLGDLAREDVKVVIAERSAGVGRFTHAALENTGLLETIENGIISKVGTVNEVALQVDLGVSDAGVIWDALIPQFKQSEFVRVAEFDQKPVQAAIAVLNSSENKTEALAFSRYLIAKDKGAKVFKKYGFDVLPNSQREE